MWPCEYVDSKGRRCINTREGHAKGHQTESGKPIGNGGYQSRFVADHYRPVWHHNLQEVLLDIEQAMTQPSNLRVSEERKAADIHLQRMNDFYHKLGGAVQFYSNATCLSCLLQDMPEHPLPCGHVICSQCVRTFGEAKSKSVFHLICCPLHSDERSQVDVRIALKPHLAGVRVLSLDG